MPSIARLGARPVPVLTRPCGRPARRLTWAESVLVDSFAPHEPWEAPPSYYSLYKPPSFHGRTVIHTRYGPLDGQMSEAEFVNMKAHYAGLVSLVDSWFGRLIEQLKMLGLYDSSLIVFTSDHGTNFADNPERIVGKPAHAMYPGVMSTPLLIHFPHGEGAGGVSDGLVSSVDIVATLYQAAGLDPAAHSDGRALQGLWKGENARPYVTCRYGDYLWYRDARHWAVFDCDGRARLLFDLRADPGCMRNAVAEAGAEILETAWAKVLHDAGGHVPDYRHQFDSATDAIGQRQ